MSNMNPTVKKSSSKESPTVFWMPLLSSGTSESSSAKVTPKAIREWILSQEGSPASPFPKPESEQGKTTIEICGLTPSNAFACFDPATDSLRMSQGSLPLGISTESWPTWPRAGMMQNGLVWELMTSERTIDESAFGFFLGTPTALSMKTVRSEKFRKGLKSPTANEFVKKWPTPTVADTFTGNLKSSQQKEGSMHSKGLSVAVGMWPTPTSQDSRHAQSRSLTGSQRGGLKDSNLGEKV